MSGGVGPTSKDISLPEVQEAAYKQQDDDDDDEPTTSFQSTEKSKASNFLSFRQLNCLVVITVLAASGMVSAEDFAFVIFSLIYMFFLFKFAFPLLLPSQPQSKQPSSVFNPNNNKILRLYVSAAAIIGLFLPIAYILEGVFEGDKEGIKAASPHVFLLASQVFMEGVAFSGKFSLPIRVFVPVFYNSRRIFTISDWLRSEFSKTQEEEKTASTATRRLYLGRALAMANMAFWSFNLFGFLLPVYLPKAFKKYYSASGGGYKLKN